MNSIDLQTRAVQNVLVLHGIRDFKYGRNSNLRHIHSFQRYARANRFVYHYVEDAVTEHLKSIPFDVVLLDATFLAWRWVRPRSAFEATKHAYSWLRDTGAYIVALPQDDYDHAALLDDWLASYKVDLLLTVCPEHWDVLYPRLAAVGTRIETVLTGYVDEDDVALYATLRRPFWERRIDVCYRVRRLPANFGRFGILKSEFGRKFAAAARNRAVLDISDDPSQTLLGEAWPRLLCDSRFSLGSESGSSVLDLQGDIKDCVLGFERGHPEASFEEIAGHCVGPLDEAHLFRAISPRMFEIALAGCCPILIRGDYRGILQAEEHYIPVSSDFSDIGSAVDRLSDWETAQRIALRAQEAVLEDQTIRYSYWVDDLFRKTREGLASRKAIGQLSREEFQRKADEHAIEVLHRRLDRASTQLSDYHVEVARLNGAVCEQAAEISRLHKLLEGDVTIRRALSILGRAIRRASK